MRLLSNSFHVFYLMHSRPKKSLHAYLICLAYVPILCICILFLLSLYYFLSV